MSNSDITSGEIRVKQALVPVDQCGMARASELIGDRWSLLILREAFYGVKRFEDVRADINAPRAVLSQRLEQLVQADILERRPYREEGSRTRYEYCLTEQGRELAPVLIALMQWGDKNLRDDPAPLEVLDRQTEERLNVVLATSKGRIVPLENVRIDLAKPR